MAKILIAENERAIAQRMAVNLRLVGHRCDQANNTRQAADLVRRNTYDLILMDLALPGAVDLRACRSGKATAPWCCW